MGENGKMKIRFIGESEENEKWKAVNPNLEDIFLYEYNEGI